jgi:CheY-like chemotaxis protein
MRGEAKDALDTARRLRADVVFLALGTPGVDGYEMARQLREDLLLRHVLIVGLEGGARIDHHLKKPVDPERMKSLLGRRR